MQYYNDAIKDFDKALDVDVANTLAYEGRALSYYYLNKYRNALKDFIMRIRITPDKEKVYNEFITKCEGVTGYKRTDDPKDISNDDDDPIPIPDISKPLLAVIIAIAFEFVLYIAYEVKSGTITGGVVVRKIVQILIISLIIFAIDAIAENISSDFNTYFLIGLFVIELGLILDDAGNLGVPIPEDLKNFIKSLINKVERILRI